LRYIGATKAIITGTFEPIIAIGSSYIILSDVLTPVQLFGAVMVISAILILQLVYTVEKFPKLGKKNSASLDKIGASAVKCVERRKFSSIKECYKTFWKKLEITL
jgi:hypothetical protein